MTEITNYRCDICGAVYADSTSANKCEAFHVDVNTVQGVQFNSISQTNIPYPAFITCKMDDGRVARYIYRELLEAIPANDELDNQGGGVE